MELHASNWSYVRPAYSYPTVELRVMDALSNTDLILAITGLYASLVVTMTNLSDEFNDYCLISEESNEITYDFDNAAHVGMTANIIDPFSGRPQTVDSILLTLYEFTRTAANEIGWDQEIKNLPNLLTADLQVR